VFVKGGFKYGVAVSTRFLPELLKGFHVNIVNITCMNTPLDTCGGGGRISSWLHANLIQWGEIMKRHRVLLLIVISLVLIAGILACGDSSNTAPGSNASADQNVSTGSAVATDGSNSTPFANAGADQYISKASLVFLNGSGSSDADGDMLTYSWSFTSVPSVSAITDAYLSDTTAVSPAFVPDVDGSYVISLVVNDGMESSAADTVTLTAAPPMAPIPAGCFDMGDAFSEGGADELPVHDVCVSGFYMDVHEVINAEYRACVDDGGCTAPSSNSSNTRTTSPFYYGNATYDDFPVMYVNWYKATAYCTWAKKRLPTEAEWEYAARGGLSGKRYPDGDTISCGDANYAGCAGDTSEVEIYAPNGYGLYDTAGNLREWTNDWYDSGYYSTTPDMNPQGPATGSYRVLRGGGWCCGTYLQRVADRYTRNPSSDGYNIGFRCVRD
jgi:formylglycine-generating enzyme required for sulfatase activity